MVIYVTEPSKRKSLNTCLYRKGAKCMSTVDDLLEGSQLGQGSQVAGPRPLHESCSLLSHDLRAKRVSQHQRVQSSRYRGETEAQRGQMVGLSFYRPSWLVSPRLPSLPLLHSASWGCVVSIGSYAPRGQACLYPPSPPWCACPAQRRSSRGTVDVQDVTGQSCPSTVHVALNPERTGRNPVQFRKSGPHFQLPAGWWRRG